MVVHKKRPKAWHRNSLIAPCGTVLIEKISLFEKKYLTQFSHYWKDVTCEKCLEFLEVVKVEKINKFKERSKHGTKYKT